MRTRVAVLALALAAACASTPDEQDARFLGCWYFAQDQAARELGLPWGIQLLPDSLAGWPNLAGQPGVAQARTLTRSGPTDTPFAYWRAVRDDSITVGYPLGGSLVLELGLEDGALAGSARPIGDARTSADMPDLYAIRLSAARCPRPEDYR